MQQYPHQPYYQPPPQPVKKKGIALAQWWHYLIAVLLSLPVVIILALAIIVIFHLPTVRPGWGWFILLFVGSWIAFVLLSKRSNAFFTYLPWSLLLLYGGILFVLFFIH